VLAPIVRREIVWHLLHSEHGPMQQWPSPTGISARIGRAYVRWIREALYENPEIMTLAARQKV